MESAAVLRSFNCSVGINSHTRSFIEKPGMLSAYNGSQLTPNRSCIHNLTIGGKLMYSSKKHKGMLVSCVKTSDAKDTAKSNDCIPQGSLEKSHRSPTFPNGFEALMLEVCDETEIAELKLKVGDFEMHLKRNIGVTKAPLSNISPTSAPPIPTKPMVESEPAAPPPSPPKTAPKSTSPFANVSLVKSPKLAALEASGSNAYVLVSSPTVGSFRKGRTVKGKKQPPICKEGELIKEGQVIGYVDQFGTELPVKTDVGGEVLKVLFNEGEAVGYGDPLIAVLPSFHGIR
ncbi:hypothetical protein CsatB_010097 [Cannabis sativa]|uniref:uncharacterized protein LOC115705379 n=1 Tax=Cannabis sativa TaxID=3483 RepID=UPI0029CA9C11|nr:uncharacterized protein LOC115705379 [Cannabis sativa]XP_060964738.1 uncharacterized protein LOC133033707 [Cannabis sativa]